MCFYILEVNIDEYVMFVVYLQIFTTSI